MNKKVTIKTPTDAFNYLQPKITKAGKSYNAFMDKKVTITTPKEAYNILKPKVNTFLNKSDKLPTLIDAYKYLKPKVSAFMNKKIKINIPIGKKSVKAVSLTRQLGSGRKVEFTKGNKFNLKGYASEKQVGQGYRTQSIVKIDGVKGKADSIGALKLIRTDAKTGAKIYDFVGGARESTFINKGVMYKAKPRVTGKVFVTEAPKVKVIDVTNPPTKKPLSVKIVPKEQPTKIVKEPTIIDLMSKSETAQGLIDAKPKLVIDIPKSQIIDTTAKVPTINLPASTKKTIISQVTALDTAAKELAISQVKVAKPELFVYRSNFKETIIPKAREVQATNYKTAMRTISAPKTISITKTEPIVREIEKTKETTKPRFDQGIKPIYRPIMKPITKPVEKPKSPTPPPIIPVPTPITPKGGFGFGLPEKQKIQKIRKTTGEPGVIPYVKRRGKYTAIGGPTTLERAKFKVKKALLTTLGASAQIRTTSGEKLQIAEENALFRPGSKGKDLFTLVQRRSKRLKSRYETAEIVGIRRGSFFK